MRNNQPKAIALGGVLAALAVVIMCLGGLVPVATYVCPALCMVLLSFVLRLCGRRIAWAWYAAVTVLCLLLGPDKEAAVLLVFLGYYPILKPRIDRLRFRFTVKMLLFNAMILLAYGILIKVFGMDQLAVEFLELGIVMTLITLILGNVTLLLLDVVLSRVQRMVRRG